MSPQMTSQQIEAQVRAFETRLNSKKLEADSLNKLRDAARESIDQVFAYLPESTREKLRDGLENFLTAKINWLLIDIQEFDLTIKALRHQQSGILIARPSNHRPA